MAHALLWPAHPQLLPDELLSSWLVRIAAANGIKVQRLCWELFGNAKSPWNRDVDRSAPDWLIEAVALHTGCRKREVLASTLTTYRHRLYRSPRFSGHLHWVTPILSRGMRRRGYGQQFCPACLADGTTPYFRKFWRLALATYCPTHRIELLDACPRCASPVMHYRGDFGREIDDALPMNLCPVCLADFREAPRLGVQFAAVETQLMFDGATQSLARPLNQVGQFNQGFFAILRKLCMIMGSNRNQGRFLRYLGKTLRIEATRAESGKRECFETLRRDERHRWLQCGLWVMATPQERLQAALDSRALRWNVLLTDFPDAPGWYSTLVESLTHRKPRTQRLTP